MKKYTVTIGISAHNEEKNIGSLLNAIMNQSMTNFNLKEVIVYCDGCIDNTEFAANKIAKKYPLIKVINDGKRVGKGQRLNKIFKEAKGEIIITMDADITLINDTVLNNIIPYFSNEKADLIGAKCLVVEVNSFFQKIQETYIKFWRDITYQINSGNNVHTHLGPLSAIRKEVAKKILIPNDVNAEDHFIYFKVKSLGYSYQFADKVCVGYKIPKYLNEFLKQYTRYLSSADNISSYFEELASNEYRISKFLKIKLYVKYLLLHPITMTFAIYLQVLERFYIKFININKNISTWDIVSSTK